MTDFATAHAGICDLFSRYTDAVWRKDYGAFGECFTDDAEWRIAGTAILGRSMIVDRIKDSLSNYQCILVTMFPPILELGDGTATGRSYVTEKAVYSDGRVSTPIGTYYDRFIDQGGRWRFRWRLFQIQYAGPADYSGRFFPNPDYGPPPAMPPLDAVPTNHPSWLHINDI